MKLHLASRHQLVNLEPLRRCSADQLRVLDAEVRTATDATHRYADMAEQPTNRRHVIGRGAATLTRARVWLHLELRPWTTPAEEISGRTRPDSIRLCSMCMCSTEAQPAACIGWASAGVLR